MYEEYDSDYEPLGGDSYGFTGENEERHEAGFVSLLTTMIERAKFDYFIFKRCAAVSFMKPTGHFPANRSHSNGLTQSELTALLEFIDRHADALVENVTGHDVPRGTLKKRLLRLERNGDWRRLFGRCYRMMR